MNNKQILAHLQSVVGDAFQEISNTPRGQRLRNANLDGQVLVNAFKALGKSEMAFQVELSKLGLNPEDETWMRDILKVCRQERPRIPALMMPGDSAPPPLRRSSGSPPPVNTSTSAPPPGNTTTSAPPTVSEDRVCFAALLETRMEIKQMLKGHPLWPPTRALIAVAGLITLKADAARKHQPDSVLFHYENILDALGELTIGESIRAVMEKCIDDYILAFKQEVTPEKKTSPPPSLPYSPHTR